MLIYTLLEELLYINFILIHFGYLKINVLTRYINFNNFINIPNLLLYNNLFILSNFLVDPMFRIFQLSYICFV